ncbi:sister chromatid cohesion 1 protein 3-like [Durio zibethinus]|uniref:Sister chromatid cohesion 1 protein 3-like n=1 Tax=Durio zibethinus TaxID=66656 RepID=A0A6P5Y300_DURZI|nr:sister chromatid cohesion 1 protein 3-like [Durio zibethinus]
MFYSHTFLSRKAPLGTVWCAAHLQHRLKKSQYIATDIPSTVDHIMFPEVPIALRMSGHLLLGVVRIYSKKVDYLFHDCNIVLIGLRKVFTSTQVNLPEDARQAPVQSITLPETLDLDAMELDGDMYYEGASDNHLTSPEDITLTDQIPVGRDAYVAVTFDEDIMMDASPPEAFLKSRSIPMTVNLHEPPENGHVGFQDPAPHDQIQVPSVIAAFQDPGPSNHTGVHGAAEEKLVPNNQTQVLESITNESSQDFPEIETMRDAPHDFYTQNLLSVCSDHRNNPTEVTGSLEQVLNEKEIHTPSLNILASGELSMPFQQHSDPPVSASNGPPDVSFVCASPHLVIQPSPPQQQPRQRRIARRRFFDEKLVLPNRLMKRALEDCSDLVRKRRKIPCSALGVWKWNNNRRIEQVFNEPLLTGLCGDICNMFKRDYISTKSQLVVPQEVAPEPTVPESTAPTTEVISELRIGTPVPDPRVEFSPASATEIDMEIERLRCNESNVADNVFPEFESFPAGSMPSPFRRDDSPFSTNSLESELGPKAGVASTPNIAPSTGTHGSKVHTHRTSLEEQSCPGNTEFSAIPEFGSSEADLYFLEEDGNTLTESIASQGVDSLSPRTRAVAKYLKSYSSLSPLSEDSHGDLSLNKILEGKTRKICARMFFETLVLKSYELVDVQQEQPYGDITLKMTATLAKAEM